MKVVGKTIEELYALFNDSIEKSDEIHEEYVWDAIYRKYPLPALVYQIKTDGSYELLQGRDVLDSALQYYERCMKNGKPQICAKYEFAAHEIRDEDLDEEIIEYLQGYYEYCTDYLPK